MPGPVDGFDRSPLLSVEVEIERPEQQLNHFQGARFWHKYC